MFWCPLKKTKLHKIGINSNQKSERLFLVLHSLKNVEYQCEAAGTESGKAELHERACEDASAPAICKSGVWKCFGLPRWDTSSCLQKYTQTAQVFICMLDIININKCCGVDLTWFQHLRKTSCGSVQLGPDGDAVWQCAAVSSLGWPPAC